MYEVIANHAESGCRAMRIVELSGAGVEIRSRPLRFESKEAANRFANAMRGAFPDTVYEVHRPKGK